MKQITLTNNKIAIVDDKDYGLVSKYKWTYRKPGYAHKHIPKTKSDSISLHRFILNPPKNKEVDHINGNGLDNRRSNLRICSRLENCKNKGFSKNNKSGFKGVHWNKTLKYWVTQVTANGKVFTKYSHTKEVAARKYNELAKKYHGEFALLNKI